jgi:hypothetical protein
LAARNQRGLFIRLPSQLGSEGEQLRFFEGTGSGALGAGRYSLFCTSRFGKSGPAAFRRRVRRLLLPDEPLPAALPGFDPVGLL